MSTGSMLRVFALLSLLLSLSSVGRAAPVEPAQPAPLAVTPSMLGNVFTTDEPVRVPVSSTADTVAWSAKDFFGNDVGAGEVKLADSRAVIAPGITRPGWYGLRVVAIKDGTPIKTLDSSFVILKPIDFDRTKDPRFGAMTHFAQNWDTDILPLLPKVGISGIRDELYWNTVETQKGVYNFGKYDPYMSACKRLGVEPLIVMSFANKLYDNGDTPHSDEGRAGYARYGQAILKHYGEQIKAIEIWNEYNGSFAKGPVTKDRPRFYAQMLNTAYDALKQTRPDIQIGGGAAVLIPIPFFRDQFKHEALDHMDAAVVHPYRGTPEGVEIDLNELDHLMKEFGGAKPVWVTETGRMDQSENGRHNVARYLPRMYTLLMSQGVERIYWYLLRDYSTFQTMGLFRDINHEGGRYAPAPALASYATLIRQLHHAKFTHREKTEPRTRIYAFARGDEQIRVAWATVPAQVALLTEQPLTLTDIMGVETTLTPVNGQVALSLTLDPVYVRGNLKGVTESPDLVIEPRQTIDVLSAAQVRVSGKPEGATVVFDNGTAVPVGARTIPMGAIDTASAGEYELRYRVHSEVGIIARGAVELVVRDPVRLEPEVVCDAPGQIRVNIVNESLAQAYQIDSIDWQAGKTSGTASIERTLPPNARLSVALAIGDAVLPVYQSVPVTLNLKMAHRSPIELKTDVSDNPRLRVSPTVDGAIDEWADKPSLTLAPVFAKAISARAWIGSDEQNLYIAADVPDVRALAAAERPGDSLAPPESIEIGTRTALRGVITKSSKNSTEIAIPWTALKHLVGDSGRVRIAIATEGATPVAWGSGISVGVTPMAMPVTRAQDAAPGELLIVSPLAPAPQSTGEIVADSVEDYSNVQGRQGWHYGYYDGKSQRPYSDEDFVPMRFTETIWDFVWGVDSIKYLSLTRTGGHPQMDAGKPIWAVRRWISTVDGPVAISGTIGAGAKGDGVELIVLVDGIAVHRELIRPIPESAKPGFKWSYRCTATLKHGSRVDLAVGPNRNVEYDGFGFAAKIERLKPR